MWRPLTAASLLLLGACEGGGDPVEQALRETASANHAATVRSSDQGPTRAGGQTTDQAYIARMIAHHESAVAMAEVALRASRDPEVRRMAQAVIDTRTREIAEMRAWRPSA